MNLSSIQITAVYTHSLSSTQVYRNGEGGDNAQGGANADDQEKEVQEEIDPAPPDMVI